MGERAVQFSESHAAVERDELLRRRIGDLELQVGGTRLERLVERLYEELETAGLSFRPPVYLSDEWGCPDRVPIIGVPFYLADARLTRLEDELHEGVEAESDDEIMRYLRHEAGHAFSYSYRLYDDEEWTSVFGPFSRPYVEDYAPQPFSRRFVRHLPGWYAQKHPDEDFAETFAVWLDPNSNWRERYADWPCLTKLEYMDALARRVGREEPPVTADDYDVHEAYLGSTLEEHYRRTTPTSIAIPRAFDAALRDIFPGKSARPGVKSEPASRFIRRHRRRIVGSVYFWTGLSDHHVRGLLDHLEERADELRLERTDPEVDDAIELTAFVATLCMNRLHAGDFLSK